MPIVKGGKGNILKGKIFGLPVPVVAIGAGVVGVIAYRKFGGGGASSSQAGADTTGATPSDYSGGSSGGGGGAADYSGGTGDMGGPYDQGLGGGGYVSADTGAGGAFVPATQAGTGQPSGFVLRKIIIRRPPRRGPRPKVVNRIVINNRAQRRRPPVSHKVPRGQTPPIIRRRPTAKRTNFLPGNR